MSIIIAVALAPLPGWAQQEAPLESAQTAVIIEVHGSGASVAGAEIRIGGKQYFTGPDGTVQVSLPPGSFRLTASAPGFEDTKATVSIATTPSRIELQLSPQITIEEEVIVTSTRTERRLEDQPVRVEVVDREDIEEKALMTPGSVAMLIGETTGLRVQTTAPSLGAVNVRIQGLRGHYSQMLSDGLPLYGVQGDSLSLLQVPPLDLGQVEIIKGAASALYGPSALGGVIDLISRRPTERHRELLLNQTTQQETDASFLFVEPPRNHWAYTLSGGLHGQMRQDLDGDGWTDMPGFTRGVLRPRLFWDNEHGRSVFATVGLMAENREGGTLPNEVAPDGHPFLEALDTRRLDAGAVARVAMAPDRLLSLRGSFSYRTEHRVFGDSLETGRRLTGFGEAVVQGTAGAHSWLLGGALQVDDYAGREIRNFDYTFATPGLIAQDEINVSPKLILGLSARVDYHNRYGTFASPRVSVLYKPARGWTARLSAGTGYFAPTPFVEETQETGLSRVQPLAHIRAERAQSISLDGSWSQGPFEVVATVFGSDVRHPLEHRVSGPETVELLNAAGPVRTWGTEFLARYRVEKIMLLLTHAYTISREDDPERPARRTVPLTPSQVVSFNAIWDNPKLLRVGFEAYYTSRQALEENPYRTTGRGYFLFGVLLQRRFGRLQLFANGENLGNIRQTRYDPLVRPTRAPDGRWTVGAWAPLDGRVINGGIRLAF